MSKGKDHKRYEFGTKVSITTTRDSKIIIGATAFDRNKYDGHTLPDALLQLKQLIQHSPTAAFCDRGYREKSQINETRIIRPSVNTGDTTSTYRELMRKRFRNLARKFRFHGWTRKLPAIFAVVTGAEPAAV